MVKFGKVDVKGNYCRTGLAQLVDELCNEGARPGLLADFAEALVVDITMRIGASPASRGAAF